MIHDVHALLRTVAALSLLGAAACGDDHGSPAGPDAAVDAAPADAAVDAPIDAPPAEPTVASATLAAGNHFSVVLDGGQVSTMGENIRAQLGMGLVSPEVSGEFPYPVPRAIALPGDVAAVYAGELHGAAVTAGGELYAWGLNNVGATGHGATPDDPTVAEPGCSVLPGGVLYDDKPNHHICTPAKVLGLPRVIKVAAGNGFTLALTARGELYAWGNNSSGQLGRGDTTRRYAPVPVVALDGKIIVDVASGNSHVLALTREGAVYAWGANRDGQLGQGPLSPNPTFLSSPVLVTGLGAEKVVALGAANFSSFAVTESKRLYAWGENDFGQLGIGSFDNDQPTPVQVTLPAGVEPVRAMGGSRHAYLLSRDGDVYSWGRVGEGQLGNGRVEGAVAEYVLTPQKVVALDAPRVVELLSAPSHALARTDTGVIFGWGSNGQGRLSLGDSFELVTMVSIPVPLDLSRTIKSVPVHAAASVSFTDTDPAAGQIAGAVAVGRAASEADVDGYTLYWGSDFGTKLAGSAPLARAAKTGAALTMTIAAATPVPAGATHLVVVSRNHRGEMALGASVALVDLAAP
jgi:alpha-tubulin suppressor-like RCC1 family protein